MLGRLHAGLHESGRKQNKGCGHIHVGMAIIVYLLLGHFGEVEGLHLRGVGTYLQHLHTNRQIQVRACACVRVYLCAGNTTQKSTVHTDT